MADKRDNDKLTEMRSRYQLACDAVSTSYQEAVDDIKFVTVPGHQWDSALRERRRNRPMYEFPKLRMHAMQVINEQRQSRPQGKVRGVEESDRGLAEIMQGLCRNIESVSGAERAYDIAHESAVKGGLGVWRVCTDYASDDDFEQDIFIKPIRNFTCVKFDPAAVEIDRRDGNFCFVEELIPRSQFEREHPGADLVDFDSDQHCVDWREKGLIRRAEYWYKEPQSRELWALSSGAVVFADEAGVSEEELALAGLEVTGRRVVKSHKVFMRLTNGREWLSAPYAFPSKFIPVVPTWGNIENIEGDDYWCGLVRYAKDQQRLHNVHKTAAIEAVAKSPKAPFIVKLGDIKGLEQYWKNANSEDYPYLPVNDGATAMPQRAGQADIPAALLQLAAIDNDDMKAATGQFDASLGARSNETSGKAINARKQQGATATFNYIDNLAYAIKFTYEILIDMIPRVYDKQRTIRILGEDGGEKWKTLYQEVQGEDGETHVINDLRKGKYDVTITVGPSYATQRMEAAEAFAQLAGQIGGAAPQIGPLLAYATLKNQDLPGLDEIDAALRKSLVSQGLLPPKEGEEPPEPPQPNPKDVADAQLKEAQTAKTGAEAERVQMENHLAQQQWQQNQQWPPLWRPQQDPMNQPPQGGFFMPDGSQQ